ncbi:MAG: hypothetical protein U9N14_05520, partial [Pseudomonadota bacterium]|nr:hypothetical protein [Pseudomonadota bacterium]
MIGEPPSVKAEGFAVFAEIRQIGLMRKTEPFQPAMSDCVGAVTTGRAFLILQEHRWKIFSSL